MNPSKIGSARTLFPAFFLLQVNPIKPATAMPVRRRSQAGMEKVILRERAGALTGVTQAASDGAQAGYNSFKSLSLSKGQLAGLAVAIVIVLALTIAALWYLCIRQTRQRKLKRRGNDYFSSAGTRSSGSSMRMSQTSMGKGMATRVQPAAASYGKTDFVPFDFSKVGRGSSSRVGDSQPLRGYRDESQVMNKNLPSAASGGRFPATRGTGAHDDGDDMDPEDEMETSFMSHSTFMGGGEGGEGPTVPLMAASGRGEGGYQQPFRLASGGRGQGGHGRV